jgi:hypothetical protein
LHQLIARDGLEAVALVEIAADHALDFGAVALGDPAQRRHEIEHRVVVEPIVDELALAPVRHETATPHVLKMLRGVGDRQTRALRQCLDAALALRKLLQQLEPMRMPERFRDSRELREQDLVWALLRSLPQTFLRTLA